jgi:pyruvate/2-oxoacid:ferredoxin oxidoreductase alpha subunit
MNMSRSIHRERVVLTGNHATAYAVKHSRVEVVPAYPITPQTTIVEKIDEFIENGELDAIMIRVESEHSAMGAALGASAVGARTYTATSSQGLLYMYENIWWASNARLPIVATFVTRALAPPWNIWSDHQDFFTLRDTGWILMFARSAQEAYDLTIQAFKIAEDPKVRLPVGIGYDGFLVSHTAEPVELLNQEETDNFLPNPRDITPLLDVDSPYSIGNLPQAEFHYILRKNTWEGMEYAKKIIYKVGKEYSDLTGRDYNSLLEYYRCEDADTIFISMGAMAGEGMVAVDRLREKGQKVGHITLRVLRPFPREEIINIMKGVKRVIILSRGYSCGKSGLMYDEIVSILYDNNIYLDTYDVMAGLAGTEVSEKDYIKIYNDIIDDRIPSMRPIFIRRGEYV